jgi:hypothetical protein
MKSPKSKNTGKSISSTKRLDQILQETEEELALIQPKIDRLEKEMERLKELKRTKQKLITLKLSIKSILENFSQEDIKGSSGAFLSDLLSDSLGGVTGVNDVTLGGVVHGVPGSAIGMGQGVYSGIDEEGPWKEGKVFWPDRAFEEANRVLRQRQSTNYEIFRAIVFNGGRATTDQIKKYLVDNGIKQPASGQGFETVELTDISSRANYLVRKGLVKNTGRGLFICQVGWAGETDESSAAE